MANHYGNFNIFGRLSVSQNVSGGYDFPEEIGESNQALGVKDGQLEFIDVETDETTYTNEEGTVIEVGGIKTGTVFNETTFEEFIELLLYPELFPNLTNPSFTFTTTPSGLREVGEVININFVAGFNRGSINPQHESDSPFRSGLPNSYNYSGPQLNISNETDSLTDSQSISDYEVEEGLQSWSLNISYDAGVQPKGSKGSDYETELDAGTTSTITRTIRGVYPFFATTDDIEQLTKQSLAQHGSTVVTEFPQENSGNKQTVEFPEAWGEINHIEQKNMFGIWDDISLDTFTITENIIKDINGHDITYRRYTHNGPTTGARDIRWSV